MKKINITLERPLVFLDLETTGLDVNNDRIIEISLIKVHPDGTRETKTRLINPTIPISPEAQDIHGITPEMVKDQPTFRQLRAGLMKFIIGCDFVGYSSNRFDIPMLYAEFDRCQGINPLDNAKFIDVYNLVAFLRPRTLAASYEVFTGKELKDNHSAEGDAKATLEIFESMVNTFGIGGTVKEISETGAGEHLVDLAGKLKKDKDGVVVFNFGKYYGRSVLTSLRADLGYSDWVLNPDNGIPSQTRKIIRQICKL